MMVVKILKDYYNTHIKTDITTVVIIIILLIFVLLKNKI